MPSALIMPGFDSPLKLLDLASTWQVPFLLVSAIVCGPRAGTMAAVAYITVGLVHLPIFQGGGYFSYLFTPNFAFLTGFIPAAWASGLLVQKTNKNDLACLSIAAFTGVLVLQSWGVLCLIAGVLIGYWTDPFVDLLFSYSIIPLVAQTILCPAVGIISLSLRGLLLIE